MSPPSSEAAALSPEATRRLRRKISNRESARRSRIRKQQHLQDLGNIAARLKTENQSLAASLHTLTRRYLLFRQENDRLQCDLLVLQQRLSEIREFLVLRQFQRLADTSSPADGCARGIFPGSEQMWWSLMA